MQSESGLQDFDWRIEENIPSLGIVQIQQSSSNHRATTLQLSGRLDATTSATLEVTLQRYRDNGATRFILDLRELEYISSAGLGALLSSAKSLQREGGDLLLFGLRENVRKVFEISGFTRIFTLYKTEEEAREYLAEKEG